MSVINRVFEALGELQFSRQKRRATLQSRQNNAISFRSPRDKKSQRVNRAVEEAQVQFQQQCPKCHFVIEFPNSPPASDGFCPDCGAELRPLVISGRAGEPDFGVKIHYDPTDQRGWGHR